MAINFEKMNAKTRVEELFFAPLYKVEVFEADDFSLIAEILCSETSFRLYCVDCRHDSVFTIVPDDSVANSMLTGSFSAKPKVADVVILKCGMEKFHEVRFMFVCRKVLRSFDVEDFEYHVVKVGQYPSLADFYLPQISKYRKMLGNHYGDFSKAIGLMAHGVGIGSFVYLRRIIEKLVGEAHGKAVLAAGWNEDEYKVKKMPEKIKILGEYLPRFLVENRNSYSILSKGIHELSETECTAYYPVVQSAICLILDQKLAEAEAAAKESEAKQALNKIHQAIATK